MQRYVITLIIFIIAIFSAMLLWHKGYFTPTEFGLMVGFVFLSLGQISAIDSNNKKFYNSEKRIISLAKKYKSISNTIDDIKQQINYIDDKLEVRMDFSDHQLKLQVSTLEAVVEQIASDLEVQLQESGILKDDIIKVMELNSNHNVNIDVTPTVRTDYVNGMDLINPEEIRDYSINNISKELYNDVIHALDSNKIDLYLQPIVSLPQRKTCYYEALTRLRDSNDSVIYPDQFITIAENEGMMPTVDTLAVFRCVKIAKRFISRGKNFGIFCNISPYSLFNSSFFSQFMDYIEDNSEVISHIYFELSQEMIDNIGPMEWENLDILSNAGFSFVMDKVYNLDIDFQYIARKGFKFLKLDSDILLDGIEQSKSPVHATDLSELLSRNGIALIAEKIETDKELLNLLDFDISLGQGNLFSEPRPVKGDLIDDTAEDRLVNSVKNSNHRKRAA